MEISLISDWKMSKKEGDFPLGGKSPLSALPLYANFNYLSFKFDL